ncbi:hypothetical protein [Zestomonas carbonaria]|uniref:Fap system outer membrane protein n=1 Tax=Zestomonas carbonaria TaxID=2762745 RepID=A0A7U7ESJ0_9GAMM|nr:hypothetical protein [Pseudomonas carbonaria]CAD5110387.1 hypothetical protein PSEWESI4_04710 [Pseudomonas carbonaria]
MKTYMLLTAICLAVSVPVQAASVFKPEELSDQELSQLRGRFVMPGQIVHFGFTMISSWENAQGQVLGARVSMQAQQNMYRPVFRVSSLNSEPGNGVAPGNLQQTGTISGGAGLHKVDGASQSIRAAGDNNLAQNDITLNVKHSNSAPALDTTGKPLTSPVQVSNSAGSVQVTPANNSVQIAIQSNGQGSTLQQIGAGALLQNTRILGSSNVVKNLAALDVVLRENKATINTLNCNWDQLRGLRPSGI